MMQGEPVFPIKVSHNGRYFVDQHNNPFFWLGNTQWQIFREYALKEAKLILENVKSKGFSVIQAMLLGVEGPIHPNVNGAMPWIDNDPASPNEAYFENVDSVMQLAREINMVISMTLYHRRFGSYMNVKNARQWARWVARRYKDFPNIIWSMTPVANQEYVPILEELAAGLREGDGGLHVITFKPDPAPYSSSFIHGKSWLAFNQIQTWKDVQLIYPMVTNDYNLKPVKPVVMAEGAYEEGTEYGFEVTPLWIRRQAYYSYLTGGHHSYGHNDSWRVLPTWKGALDAPGACQMGVLKKTLMDREEWWDLVPDQSILKGGGQTDGEVLDLAARHEGGKWILAYLASRTSFNIDMGKITGGREVNAFWIDPKTGSSIPIGIFANRGVKSFRTPDELEDAILVAEAVN